MTTTVTIAGRTFEADHHVYDHNGTLSVANWISTGPWVQDTVTERATALLAEARASCTTAGYPVREPVDAAMRLQRLITAHTRVERFQIGDTGVTGQVDDLESLVGAVEELFAKLPDLAYEAVYIRKA